uniref:Uncharacterized protein n=1 Tax=Rhizophora mucronata TaxID=61149 RepID=A0A2P2P6P9_RHIMU
MVSSANSGSSGLLSTKHSFTICTCIILGLHASLGWNRKYLIKWI